MAVLFYCNQSTGKHVYSLAKEYTTIPLITVISSASLLISNKIPRAGHHTCIVDVPVTALVYGAEPHTTPLTFIAILQATYQEQQTGEIMQGLRYDRQAS